MRKRHEYNQKQLAKKLNTNQSTFAHYENGMYLITTYFLYDLLKLYSDSSADDIFKKDNVYC